MRKVKWAIAICIVLAICAITYALSASVPKKSFVVDSVYKNQYAATCAVVDSSTPIKKIDDEVGGTGVLLQNGFILTAKHIVDTNWNGKIDAGERRVLLKFYYPKKKIVRGTVVFFPPGIMRVNRSLDYAFIKPDKKMHSNIEIITNAEYNLIGVGRKLYTIGRTEGVIPNITFGNKTTNIKGYAAHRAAISVWYGNSGGGVFNEDGKLIGIMVSLKPTGHGIVPQWGQYTPVNYIRTSLKRLKSDSYLICPVDYTFERNLLFILCFLPIGAIGGIIIKQMVSR